MKIYLAGGGEGTKEKVMKLYLAGEHPVKNGTKIRTWKGINILETFYYARNNKLFPELRATCDNFMLDSGAFTLRKTNVDIDWDKYVDEYAEFIKTYAVAYFFELDIDNIIGLKNVERLRKRLESKCNKQSIPVWHPNRGKDYFISMCKEYKYVSLGGIVNSTIKLKDYILMFPWFINTAHEYGAKIHGLGFTSLKWLPVCKFDSVDSKAWLSGNMSGYIYKFLPSGEMQHIKKPDSRLRSTEAALHNFSEWVKFSKYAELYL